MKAKKCRLEVRPETSIIAH